MTPEPQMQMGLFENHPTSLGHHESGMNVDDSKEDLYFEGFEPPELQKILERQKKVIEDQKKNKQKIIQCLYLCGRPQRRSKIYQIW